MSMDHCVGGVRPLVALMLCLLPAVTVGQGQLIVVDPLNPPGTQPSLRAALAIANPAVPTVISIRGRAFGGSAVLHDDAVENWNALGTLVIPHRCRIEWDEANSDSILGVGKVRPTFSGIGTVVPCMTLLETAPMRRSNTGISGLSIVAFTTGILANVTTSLGNGGLHAAKIENMTFNQNIVGIDVAATADVRVDHRIADSMFDNTAQPAAYGGGRGLLVPITTHLRFFADLGGVVQCDVVNDDFTSDRLLSVPVLPLPDTRQTAGIVMVVNPAGQLTTEVKRCGIFGNSDATAAPNPERGLDYGLLAFAFSSSICDYVVRNCFVRDCAYVGASTFATGQGPAAPPFGDPFQLPDEADYIHPRIEMSSFVNNGYVAPLVPPTIRPPETGHGISFRSYLRGLVDARVVDCKAEGSSAGLPDEGIRMNAEEGVNIVSDSTSPFGVTPVSDYLMFYTRNDTWVDGCDCYENGLDGVNIYLRNGSGNPGVKGNSLYHNGFAGVNIEVTTSFQQTETDRLLSTPVVWNNFIYNMSVATTRQRFGIVQDHTYNFDNSMVAAYGIAGNTVTYMDAIGIFAATSRLGVPEPGGIVGNIAYFTVGSADIARLGIIAADYNCSSNVTGGGNINADPQLASPLLGNLHITLGSPCIDQVDINAYGAVGPGFTDDFDRNARPIDVPPLTGSGFWYDIGADEHTGVTTQ